MKKIIVIGLIVVLIIAVIYYRDNLTNLTMTRKNIEYYDNPIHSKDPVIWNRITKEGYVTVLSIDGHEPGYSNTIMFNGWKPYEKLEIFKETGKLYIYYEEKNTIEKENIEISFPLSFSTNKKNTRIYINGELINQVEFLNGLE